MKLPRIHSIFFISQVVASCHAQGGEVVQPADPKEREAIKFCEDHSTPGLPLTPIKNSRGKWDCVACVGTVYTDPKTGSKGCCDLGTDFTTDAVNVKEGDCCEQGSIYSFDSKAGVGGCCAPGQTWVLDRCQPPKPPQPPPVPDIHPRNECTDAKCPKGYVCACDGHLGIKYGQCYTLTDVNGLPLNRDTGGIYQSGGDIGNLIFRVCKTTANCDESKGTPVPEGGNWALQDQLGDRATPGPGWFANLAPHMGIYPASLPTYAANFTAEPFCFFGSCSLCLRLASGPYTGISAPCPLGANAAMAHLGQSVNPNNCKAYRFQEIACMKGVPATLPK